MSRKSAGAIHWFFKWQASHSDLVWRIGPNSTGAQPHTHIHIGTHPLFSNIGQADFMALRAIKQQESVPLLIAVFFRVSFCSLKKKSSFIIVSLIFLLPFAIYQIFLLYCFSWSMFIVSVFFQTIFFAIFLVSFYFGWRASSGMILNFIHSFYFV